MAHTTAEGPPTPLTDEQIRRAAELEAGCLNGGRHPDVLSWRPMGSTRRVHAGHAQHVRTAYSWWSTTLLVFSVGDVSTAVVGTCVRHAVAVRPTCRPMRRISPAWCSSSCARSWA